MKQKFRLLPLWLYAVLSVVLSIFTVWTNDAVAYQYYSPVFDEFHARPVNSIIDVWNSQIDHYMITNGRFVVHLFVQLFCALLGKISFAIANGIAWFVLLYNSLKFAGIKDKSPSLVWFGASMVWIVFLSLPSDPPFQINYIWVAAALCPWIGYFLRSYDTGSVKTQIFMCLISVICGSLHEGFSIPVACSLTIFIIYRLYRHKRVDRMQWLMAISFGVGTVVTSLAPGNFLRISQLEDSPDISFLRVVMSYVENGVLLWSLLLVLAVVFLLHKRGESDLSDRLKRNSIFILSFAALMSFAMCCKLGYFGRVVLPACYFMVLIILIVAGSRKIPVFASAVTVITALALTSCKFVRQHDLNGMSLHITEEYHRSSDGIVYDSSDRILRNPDEVINFKWVYTKRERLTVPDKPLLTVRPDIMRSRDFEKDTNMVVRLGDQSWLLVQSKNSPADFYIDKILLPGLIDKPMSPRVVVFSDSSDIVFDTIGPRRAAIYTNKRPFIHSAIRMEIPDQAH